jgi:TRAP-type C4-dicarboxylate transport system permease small subunit
MVFKQKHLLIRIEILISRYFFFYGALVQQKIAGICILFLALVTLITVVGRRSPWSGAWLVGGLEVSELLMSVISIYAAAYCWYSNGHLRITFLRDRVGAKTRNLFDILSSFLFAIWIGAVAVGMLQMAVTYIRAGSKGWGIGIPSGPFMAGVFFASAFFFLVLLKDFLSLIKKLVARRVNKNESD